jgi:hypothetical protein
MRLQRRRQRGNGLSAVSDSLRVLAPVLVGGVCAVYLLLLAALTIRWAGSGGWGT